MRESEENRRELTEDELPLEKNDGLAMFLAGMITIGLPCLIIIGVVVAVTLLLFT